MKSTEGQSPFNGASCLGIAAIVYGVFSAIFAIVVNLDGPLGIQTTFALLGIGQIPAGIGMLKHRGWSRPLSQGLAAGTIVLVLLWYAVTTLGFGQFSDTGRGWASLGILWLLGINFGLQVGSIKRSFSEPEPVVHYTMPISASTPKETSAEGGHAKEVPATRRTWYVRRGAEVRGPFRSRDIRQLAATGQIGPRTPLSVCKAGERPTKWFPAGQVSELQFLPDETLIAPDGAQQLMGSPAIALDQTPIVPNETRVKSDQATASSSAKGYAILIILAFLASAYLGVDLFPWRPGARDRDNPLKNLQQQGKQSLSFGINKGLTTEEIVKQSEKSVVRIQGKLGSASGFYVSYSKIATCAHALDGEFVGNLVVVSPNSAIFRRDDSVKLAYIDYDRDLAILETSLNKPPLQLVKDGQFRRGEDLVIIGNPSLGDAAVLNNAVTRALLSSEFRLDGVKYYQLDAAINPGNSGSPAINKQGEVVGLVVASATQEQSLAFCVPAKDVSDALLEASQSDDQQKTLISVMHNARACYSLLGILQAAHNELVPAERDFMSSKAQAFADYARMEPVPTDPVTALPETMSISALQETLAQVADDERLESELRNDLVGFWNCQIEMRELYLNGPAEENWFSASNWFVDLDEIHTRQVELMDRLDAHFGVTSQ